MKVIEKPVEMDALQHDGTHQSALQVIDFFNGRNVTKFSIDERREDKYTVAFSTLRDPGRQLVFPGWWVLALPTGRVVSLSHLEFKKKYVPYSESAALIEA